MEPQSLSYYASRPPEAADIGAKRAIRSQTSGFDQLREAFSQTNPRKRMYPHDSTTAEATTNSESDVAQCGYNDSRESASNPSPKRSRVLNWPLKNSNEPGNNAPVAPPVTRCRRTPSRGRSANKKTSSRPSKFQEGSLNDKPSKQPPDAFLGAENAIEQYYTEQEAGTSKDDIYDIGVESARLSNVFRFGRFGKAVANVWQGIWKEKDPLAPPPNDKMLDERKARAEDAYALLKMNGYKGTQSSSTRGNSQNLLGKESVDDQDGQRNSFRDSAIDINESQRSSLQAIRTEKMSEGLKPPSNTASKRSTSPASRMVPGRRSSSLHLRTPSFQSLKKVKSHIHMPSLVRPAETAPLLPAISGQINDRPNTQGLRRQPSKKDLAKYQRLSKKVSDLESKLDIARRDLENSLIDVPPVPDIPAQLTRKPFTPGALSSLPSERLLTPQISATPIAHTNTEISGSVIVSSASDLLSSPSRQLDHELRNSFNEHAANNSRTAEGLLSSDPIARPDIDGVDHASWVTAQAAKNRRKSSRRVSEQTPSIDGKIPADIKKRQSTAFPRAPKNSPAQKEDITPPVPAISITADKAIKPRPASPFLGRSGAASPVRTRSRTKKREVSPPPSILSSASRNKHNTRFAIHDHVEKDTALIPTSAASNRQKSNVAKGSPAPKAVQLKAKAARAKAVRVSIENGKGMDKPLPDIQTQTQIQIQAQNQTQAQEEFEWDEDVF